MRRLIDAPISDVARISRLISNIATNCNFDQKYFRFYVDDGAINAATAAAAENTDIATAQIALDTNIRLRIGLHEDSASGTAGKASGAVKLQYRVNAGSWTDVTGSSNVVRSSASAHVADGAACTRVLSTTNATFVDNKFDEGDGTAGSTDLVADRDYEQEFCFQVRSADVSDADVIDFRILHNNIDSLMTFTATPTYTVEVPAVPAYDQDSFRFRNDDGTEANATWKANANTNVTLAAGIVHRLRFLLQCADAGETAAFKFQYNLGGAGWNDVTNSSSVLRFAMSNLTNGNDTTQQIGAGTFISDNNGQRTSSAVEPTISTEASKEWETELSFSIVASDVVKDNTIQVRCVESDGTELATYTNTPTITVSEQNEETLALCRSGAG